MPASLSSHCAGCTTNESTDSEGQENRTKEEVLLELDEILGLKAGTLRGTEKLEELERWDSTALVGMIVLAESINDTEISMDDVVGCSTVADLLRIAGVDGVTADLTKQ